MTFYQAGDKVNSPQWQWCRNWIMPMMEAMKTQTLKFTWYIDKNGDIYIRYNDSGATCDGCRC